MSAHSKIGPSSADRWMACPGSVLLSEKCPPSATSVHAAEGSVAHVLAEQATSGAVDDMTLMGRVGEIVVQEGHDIEIDEEMVMSALEYRDLIAADIAALDATKGSIEVQEHTELRVHIASISPDLWGTADKIIFKKGKKLIVYDYKYGKGKPVEVKENPQMGLYTLGAVETVAGEVFDEIELVIVQPRCPHAGGKVRRWTVPKAWLKQFRADAHAAVIETKNPNAKLVAGKHCYWCPAKEALMCPEIQAAAQRETQADFAAMPPLETEARDVKRGALPMPHYMTPAQISRALEWEDPVGAWFTSVANKAREMLSAGLDVPGWKLVDGRSTRKWADGCGEQAALRFANQHPQNKIWSSKVISPAQMEKLVGKGKIDDLIVFTEPRPSIARDSDPRRIVPSGAKQDFDPFNAPPVGALALPAPVADPFAVPAGVVDPFADPFAAPATDLLAEAQGGRKGPIWPV